jgi:hypothetical protein
MPKTGHSKKGKGNADQFPMRRSAGKGRAAFGKGPHWQESKATAIRELICWPRIAYETTSAGVGPGVPATLARYELAGKSGKLDLSRLPAESLLEPSNAPQLQAFQDPEPVS